MSLSLTITCEKIDEIVLRNYECRITLMDITEVELDRYKVKDLIELVSVESLLDAIGKDACIKHFGIEEAE